MADTIGVHAGQAEGVWSSGRAAAEQVPGSGVLRAVTGNRRGGPASTFHASLREYVDQLSTNVSAFRESVSGILENSQAAVSALTQADDEATRRIDAILASLDAETVVSAKAKNTADGAASAALVAGPAGSGGTGASGVQSVGGFE